LVELNDPNIPAGLVDVLKDEETLVVPNIELELLVVTAVAAGFPNKLELVFPPPKMLPPPVEPPKTFFEVASVDGVDPSPLKSVVPPPNMLLVLDAVLVGFGSALPPNIEEAADVVFDGVSDILNALPPNIDDDVDLLSILFTAGAS
jgi:hypothetical protein